MTNTATRARAWKTAAAAWLLFSVSAADAGTVQDWIAGFANSDIRFQRSTSKVPFVPLGYAEVSYYGDTDVQTPDRSGQSISFDQTLVSQGAVLPFLVSRRDAVMVGEWLGWSKFDTRSTSVDSFNVFSAGLPVGWLRQANPDWQLAAFVMPLAHRASLPDSEWSWETMAGAFGRYVSSERLWWAFGAFADVGPGEDLYLPYLGAAWSVTDEWTLSAVLPWPAVLYAPTRDTLFRFGAAPSGASWVLHENHEEVSLDIDTWDLGLGIERRLTGNIWAGLEAGIGGLRGLRVTSTDIEGPDFDIGASPYLSISIQFRPELNPGY